MSYSGAEQAKEARAKLGEALAALQQDPNIPQDVMAVAQNVAQAVKALFEAEQASSEQDGKSCVRHALSTLSQTLALLQDVRTRHDGIEKATESIAKTMSLLYPLTTKPSIVPPSPRAQQGSAASPSPGPASPAAEAQPGSAAAQAPSEAQAMAAAPTVSQQRAKAPAKEIEVNVGATTASNFYVGFSGEVSEGGVFYATYEVLPPGTPVKMLVTLPGGFEFRAEGVVHFVRDPMDLSMDSEPGMGIRFTQLSPDARALVLRFIRKRAPLFYDE